MKLFNFGKEPAPTAIYKYTQTENYRNFKRIKLSSYGYKTAEKNIKELANKDLTDATIEIKIFDDKTPRAEVYIMRRQVGTIWPRSFDKYSSMKRGGIKGARIEIRDGDAYLFYKI